MKLAPASPAFTGQRGERLQRGDAQFRAAEVFHDHVVRPVEAGALLALVGEHRRLALAPIYGGIAEALFLPNQFLAEDPDLRRRVNAGWPLSCSGERRPGGGLWLPQQCYAQG